MRRNRICCGSASFSARQNGFNQKCRSNCSEFEGQTAERYKPLDHRNYPNFLYSDPQSGFPVLRSKTHKCPVLVGWTTTSISLPSFLIVAISGGDRLS